MCLVGSYYSLTYEIANILLVVIREKLQFECEHCVICLYSEACIVCFLVCTCYAYKKLDWLRLQLCVNIVVYFSL